MTELQGQEVLELLAQIAEKLEWLDTIASWLSFHVSVWVPGILIIGLMWWVFRQFIERYY